MLKQHAAPETLADAVRYFADPNVCREFVANLRWPNGVECPHCGCTGKIATDGGSIT